MAEDTLLDTRTRILRAALEEFAARGYYATSVREIAERVGVTKTAVLYHFPGKAEILGALAEPMLNDLDAAMAAADLPDPDEARWAAVEGLLSVWLVHRYLIRLNLQDLAMVGSGAVFERFCAGTLRANALVAGPDPDFADRVLAAQAIAMLSDPVILFADAPVEALRTTVLRGVHRLLDDDRPPRHDATGEPAVEEPGPAVRPARGRRGRPPAMSAEMIDTARRRYDSGSTADEIAAALGVSRATVYRYVAATAD